MLTVGWLLINRSSEIQNVGTVPTLSISGSLVTVKILSHQLLPGDQEWPSLDITTLSVELRADDEVSIMASFTCKFGTMLSHREKESSNEGSSTSGWPMDVSLKDYFEYINCCGKAQLSVGSASPWARIMDSITIEYACILLS